MPFKHKIQEKALQRIMKSDMSARLIDGLRDAPNPFEQDEHIVLTGSATSHYMWYRGMQDTYIYKPPSDIDLTLATPPGKERNLDNVPKYMRIMKDTVNHAIEQGGLTIGAELISEYDGKIYAKKTYSADEMRTVLEQDRITDMLAKSGVFVDAIDLPDSVTVRTEIDLLILDNSIINTVGFDDSPDKNSILRREAPSACVAFKMARAMLAHKDPLLFDKPGDYVDVYNTVNSPGYDHDPELLRIMTVIALARQAPTTFSFDYSDLSESGNDPVHLQKSLRAKYNTHFDNNKTQSVLEAWRGVAKDIFPDIEENGAQPLTEREEDFVMNFLNPLSGDPSVNIDIDLLRQSDAAKSVFETYPEMEALVKGSTFSHHRIAFQQISPEVIPV